MSQRYVAHVALAIHICCKCIFEMFHLFFRRIFASVSSGYSICFIDMLQVFLSGCCINDFSSIFRCFCKCFR
jgi:hypothetical protein